MCVMFNITDADIIYAEKILLRENQHFDAERIAFIKNLETIDLQAVPGSGKTTALLAKLLILERYMPLENNSGILVISHTNAAVDEIRARIGKYCPQLFSYPNFVGTIQSFVDTFLAIPCYINKFKSKPYRVDDEIYYEKNLFIYNSLKYGTKQYLDRKKGRNGSAQDFFVKIKLDINGNLLQEENGSLFLKNKLNPSNSFLDIIEKKEIILSKWGVLSYFDAFILAQHYLSRFPAVIKYLQKRFKYVFVDEMQDMEHHQYKLLERLFYDERNSISVYQRIGDKNQAISSNKVKLEDIWQQRNLLYINGSYRLTTKTAPIVEKLALTSNEIVGKNKNEDNTDIDIKPHILIYNDNTINKVIPKFAEIIKEFQRTNKIPNVRNNKFMAIGWIKGPRDDGKITISSYWNDYSIIGYKKQIDFKVLEDYLLFLDKEKKTLESVRKNILNALLKIMRLENILDENNRVYSKRKLLQFLKENFTNEYEDLKLNTYKWSIRIIKGKSEEVFESVKEYVPTFLQFFGKGISHSNNFINNNSEINIEDIEIKIGRAHV